jgi:hypothetical protein
MSATLAVASRRYEQRAPAGPACTLVRPVREAPGRAANVRPLVPSASALAATAILVALAVCRHGSPLVARSGRFAWGGAHEVLPPRLRIASVISIALYGAIALALLDAADVVDALPGRWTGTAAWVLAGYFLLGVAMNAASRSREERRTMTPVALALCLLCVAVAVGA